MYLTSNVASQTGTVMWPGMFFADAWSANIKFKIDLVTGGADGMTIFLTSAAAGASSLGTSGGGLGYGGIGRSVAIRFDTYVSSSTSTLGILYNGSIPSAGGEIPVLGVFNWMSGNVFDVVWAYIPGATPNSVGNMTLRVQETVTNGAIRNYFFAVNLFSYLCPGQTSPGCMAWFGASAGTGGSSQRHQITRYGERLDARGELARPIHSS